MVNAQLRTLHRMPLHLSSASAWQQPPHGGHQAEEKTQRASITPCMCYALQTLAQLAIFSAEAMTSTQNAGGGRA